MRKQEKINSLINTIKNIAKTLESKSKNINDNLDKNLKARLERNDNKEVKYINSLKYNVIFYKVSIRNREGLLLKWLKEGEIPTKEERQKEFEAIVKKSRVYVQDGIKTNGQTFSEMDQRTFASYKNLYKNSLKLKLEEDYKRFNIYNDVLSVLINDLSIDGVDYLASLDSKEVANVIRVELMKATNYIMVSIESLKKHEDYDVIDEEFKTREMNLHIIEEKNQEIEQKNTSSKVIESVLSDTLELDDNVIKDDDSFGESANYKDMPEYLEEHLSRPSIRTSKSKNTSKKVITLLGGIVAGIAIFSLGMFFAKGSLNKNNDEASKDDLLKNEQKYDEESYESEGNESYVESNSKDESASEELAKRAEDPNAYLIDDSDYRYLDRSELERYTTKQLAYIRNEIFARRGYMFESEDYYKYFTSKSWYTPNYWFSGDESEFNEVEVANIKLIKSIENSRN